MEVRNSYTYRVVDQWNQLPHKLKTVEKVQTFKRNLRKMGGQPVGRQQQLEPGANNPEEESSSMLPGGAHWTSYQVHIPK
jgi:hypothetical protein